jgi:hypothetical protein
MSKIEVNQISSQCGSTLTIGQSGDTVTLACGATQTGFGRTGTVDWCTTAKTAPFTGVSGKGYFVNTTCGAVTVTLPATPTAGDIISIKDYARTAATNNINFCRNGSKMDGVCASGIISTNGESTTLIYVDGTQGWTSILDSTTNTYGAQYVTATGGTIITSGDYKTHIFTSDGCFAVSSAGNPVGSDTVDYFLVAGAGGGGGPDGYSGGGGAGGFRISNSYLIPAPTTSPLANPTGLPVSIQTYPITVGGGGAAGACSSGSSGNNSIFSTITSAGGGGGGYDKGAGTNGGSGGGGGGGSPTPAPNTKQGGAGNTPPVSPPQGNNGGNGNPGPQPASGGEGGGGGGAGAVGTNASPCVAGPGGAGSFFADAVIGPTAPSYGTPGPVGSTRYFSGGGGGGTDSTGTNRGTGGDGGGGQGAPISAAGTANTGGGGGGGSHPANPPSNGSAGGSGIVMIRYKFQ